MKLNCKPGDLAIIVRSFNGNEGKIVRCLRLVFAGGTFGYGPRWVTDPPVAGTVMPVNPVLDACLRPIRPEEDTDEMLRIAGLPKRDEVVA